MPLTYEIIPPSNSFSLYLFNSPMTGNNFCCKGFLRIIRKNSRQYTTISKNFCISNMLVSLISACLLGNWIKLTRHFDKLQPLYLLHPSTSRRLICWQSHIKSWKVCRTLELILVLLTHIPNFCVPSITSFYFTCSPGLCGRIPCLLSGTIGNSTSSFVWNTRISFCMCSIITDKYRKWI